MPYRSRSRLSTEFWVILGIFIAGLFVRLYRLGGPSLGDDEILTVMRIDRSFLDTICLIRKSSFPPLHYGILNLWVHVFGNGEWALRFPSAVFSGLTVIVIYKLGKELFSKEVGLIAAAFLAFSPFAIHYAQFAKMYALFWFLSACSFLFFFRFLKDQNKSDWLYYIIASVLCCYTMYIGFLLLAAQNVIFLLMGDKDRRGKWFSGQLAVGSLCIPWVVWFLCSQHEVWGGMRPSVEFDYGRFLFQSFLFIIGSAQELWTRESWAQFSFKQCFWVVNAFLYVFLITFLLSDVLIGSDKNRKERRVLPKNVYGLLIWIAVPILIYFAFDSFFVHVDLEPRYVGFIQVPIILLVSSQINNVQWRVKRVLLFVMLVIALNSAGFHISDSQKFPQQDWRGTAQKLARDLGEHDIVLSLVYVSQFKYYYKGDTSRFLEVSEKDCSTELLEKKGILNPNVRSVFVLYKESLASDIRLKGFIQDYKVGDHGIGFLHFRRQRL